MHNTIIVLVTVLAIVVSFTSIAIAAPTSTSTGMTYQKMLDILDDIVVFVLRMAGFAAIGVIVYFGVRMLLAGGDQTKYAEARKGFNWALVGTLVIFGVYTIIATIRGAVESVGR